MHLFYTPDIQGDKHTLPEEESKHCIRVLRLTEGEIIHLVDGRGGWYRCEIITPNPKHCEVRILEKEEDHRQRDFHLHIAIAPTKNIERLEWFLEKATEIGVDEITPLLCEHSERRVVKAERLEKVLVAAMKQSLKAYLPTLNPLTDFRTLVSRKADGLRCIAHCEKEEERRLLKNAYRRGENATILIGPEGDFSPVEIELAKREGFIPISLGDNRLRTETAGIVACHSIQFMNE